MKIIDRHGIAVISIASSMLLITVSCGKSPSSGMPFVKLRKSVAVSEGGATIVSEAQQDTLLAIARRAITGYLATGKEIPLPAISDPALTMTRGCMVKLLRGAVTRGTSGYILPIKPLAAGTAEMAVRATVGNQKNGPVKREELDSITIELSVVGDPQTVEKAADIQVGTHGLIVSRGASVGGILLPGEIAQMANADSAIGTLLGMSRSSREEWKKQEIQISAFAMQIFREQ
ncbi:MAG: AMMECR1 domain-containing protein [Chitinispirillaceae bacterium]|nr:AMMECR1 domain-containing protein [Chitinispirillaceae bacterium]